MKKPHELEQLFGYLKEILLWRFQNAAAPFEEAPAWPTTPKGLFYDMFSEEAWSTAEKTIVLLALVPHVLPHFLTEVVAEAFPKGTDLPIFGAAKSKQQRGILPTGETVQFLIGGVDIEARIACMAYFQEDHLFHKKEILYLETMDHGDPSMSGKVLLREEMRYQLLTGTVPPPKLSTQFPAERLETELAWEDLVLQPETLTQIKELETWLQFQETLMEKWNMKVRLKPGYRALFHGPPGTGKTLTAALLGKYTKQAVYRIDLSTVVSKYIGETEKHLSNLFDRAAHKDWILFFDEADAIFGKRTNVRDAHDKYANQEVSYLLQRIESHSGLVILATNFKDNMDDAFTRRFQSMVSFQTPGVRERKLLWEKNMPKPLRLSSEIDLELIARKFELSGSNIVNIIQYCSLQVLSAGKKELSSELLLHGIKKEYGKENRLF